MNGCLSLAKEVQTSLSSKAALKLFHRIRSMHNGILVGSKTIEVDNPRLTVRYNMKAVQQPIVFNILAFFILYMLAYAVAS